jgi:ABC-2 type transport system permease protein
VLTLLSAELAKTARLARTGIGYAAIAVVVPLILWGLARSGELLESQFTRGLEGQFFIVGSMMNGYTAAVIVMNFLWVHIPFLITLVAGDILSGEAVRGTWRVWLTRRPSRLRVVAAKYLVAQGYALSLVALLALVSLGLGLLLMGPGDVLTVGADGVTLLGEELALPRLALAYACAGVAMASVAALAFLVGTLVEHPIGPIVGSMAVLIVLLALSNLPIETFAPLRPWLFTSHFDLWSLALEDPLPWGAIGRSAGTLAAWTALFTVAAFAVFLRKDILS